MSKILIEGWRGVNHSFALVNQHQILALLKLPGVELFHRDMPFAMAHWSPKTHDAGFDTTDAARIAALREPDADEAAELDACISICSPFHTPPAARRCPTLTFMVTEMGLSARSFEGQPDRAAFVQGGNRIFTPSNWARERVLEWGGWAPEQVQVVPHGVAAQTCFPLGPEERLANRRALGLQDEEHVFLNLGAAIWNKGLDVLLLAYATLRQSRPRARLIVKDQRNLYGVGLDGLMSQLCSAHPALFTAETVASVLVVGSNLNQAQLRALYGVADCYVSPYRAEGFNLPVLEALACGTPAIVTDGGATDDFCSAPLALRVASTPGTREDSAAGLLARFREPRLEAVVEAMRQSVDAQALQRNAAFESARLELVARMTWQHPAQQLLALAQPASAPPAAPTPAALAALPG